MNSITGSNLDITVDFWSTERLFDITFYTDKEPKSYFNLGLIVF